LTPPKLVLDFCPKVTEVMWAVGARLGGKYRPEMEIFWTLPFWVVG
jgi:hypothetical protein